jgi:hypothetical protein
MMMDHLAAWVSWAAFEGMALFPMVCVSTIALAAPYVALRSENFREQIDGKQVSLFAIRNRKDMEARITNYGARIEQVLVPDHCGQLGDWFRGTSPSTRSETAKPQWARSSAGSPTASPKDALP